MSQLRTPSPDPIVTESDSDSEPEDMFVALGEIPTIAKLFKESIIRAAPKARFPADASLLDRVSLLCAVNSLLDDYGLLIVDHSQGDITKLSVDAIVNAANKSLLGGGGVDGAIHAAAGRDLLAECRPLGGCETGQSKITGGHKLPAKHIIHTVGPIYSSSDIETKATQLASCYRTSLELAAQNALKHIAFPSISTGIYGYPIEDATHIALDEVRKFVSTAEGAVIERVIFVVWSNKDRDVYRELLPEYFAQPESETSGSELAQDKKSEEETPVEHSA